MYQKNGFVGKDCYHDFDLLPPESFIAVLQGSKVHKLPSLDRNKSPRLQCELNS